jgi:hypothetical protein
VIMNLRDPKYEVYRANFSCSLTIEANFTLTSHELGGFGGSSSNVSDDCDAQESKTHRIAFPTFKLIEIAAASLVLSPEDLLVSVILIIPPLSLISDFKTGKTYLYHEKLRQY